MMHKIFLALLTLFLVDFAWSRAKAEMCSGDQFVPLHFAYGLPYIEIKLNGSIVRAYIDTGSPRTLAGSGLKLRPSSPEQVTRFESYYGDLEAYRAHVDSFMIGKCRLGSRQVHSFREEDSHAVDEMFRRDLILGRDFLGQFDIIIDGGRSIFIFRAAKNSRDRTESAYTIKYEIDNRKGICMFDTGFSSRETILVHYDSPLRRPTARSDVLDPGLHVASSSGEADFLWVSGQIAEGPTSSYLVAIEKKGVDRNYKTLDYCVVGSRFIRDKSIIMMSSKRMVNWIRPSK